jgi:hypothetical protein
MGNIRHKSKPEIARRTARCSLRLTEEDLTWVRALAQRYGLSVNGAFELLIRSARQSCEEGVYHVMRERIETMN